MKKYDVCVATVWFPRYVTRGRDIRLHPQRGTIEEHKITYIVTYDHRTLKTRLPVRSALFKERTGGLVVRWVTTSEYPLLYIFTLCVQLRCILTASLGSSWFFGCEQRVVVLASWCCVGFTLLRRQSF